MSCTTSSDGLCVAAVSSRPFSPKEARVEDQDQDVFDGEDVFEASERAVSFQ